MRLILSRHGNTFGPGDPVVWAGATNDLPLVEKGLQQANQVADYLIQQNIKPVAVYCSELQRTKTFATILIQRLNLNIEPLVDKRLHELDYGDWTGLSNDDIIKRFGEDELKEWDEFSRWPKNGFWGGSEAATIEEVTSFANELREKYTVNDTVIAVSSNGRLRYFLTLIPNEFEKRRQDKTLKVKTGNICEFLSSNSHFELTFWNKTP